MEVEKLIKLFKGSQKEMAAKLGTTESRISEYKKGKHAITVKKLKEWCEILNIDIKKVI